MKEKKKDSLTTLGIVFVVISAIVMIIHYYQLLPNEPFHMRVLEGAWHFLIALFGAGLVFLVLFLAIYAASHLSSWVFHGADDSENYMEYFMKLKNPMLVVGFIVSYIIVFFGL